MASQRFRLTRPFCREALSPIRRTNEATEGRPAMRTLNGWIGTYVVALVFLFAFVDLASTKGWPGFVLCLAWLVMGVVSELPWTARIWDRVIARPTSKRWTAGRTRAPQRQPAAVPEAVAAPSK